jgi:hypothetical protein
VRVGLELDPFKQYKGSLASLPLGKMRGNGRTSDFTNETNETFYGKFRCLILIE